MAPVSLVLALVLARPAGDAPSRPAAEAAEAALRHWEAGRFDEARKAIARAYMIEPWRQYLYARAQIERADDECADAIEFYRLYLAEQPPADAVKLAEDGIAECERILAATPPAATGKDAIAPELRTRRPWWRDVLGTTLAIGGGATVLVGGGMFTLVAVDRRAAERSEMHDEFARRTRRAERASIAGVALVSIGAALLTAGVIRLAVVQARARGTSRRQARVARWSIDPATLTLRW